MAALVRRLEALERRLTELGSADVLKTAGVAAEPNLIRIQGSLVVEGDLSVPNGSIDNDALVHAVTGSAGHATTGVTPVSTVYMVETDHAAVSFTVPAGFTAAAVMGTSAITSIVRSHTCRTVIAGDPGDFTECHPDEAGGAGHARVLTDLSGGSTFTVLTRVMANASGGYVHAMTSALVLFYR